MRPKILVVPFTIVAVTLMSLAAMAAGNEARGGAVAWVQQAKLTPSDLAPGDNFGNNVAIDGYTIVVGAIYKNYSAGAAYIFGWDGTKWAQQAKLLPSDSASGQCFGQWVAIDGDTVVVGAWYANIGGMPYAGAAYVFQRNQGGLNKWGQVKKLVASDGAANDHFGTQVAIDGDVIAVGAFDADPKGERSGAAYVFERNSGGTNNWGQTRKLVPSDGAAYDAFGSVAVNGDTILVGAPGARVPYTSGAAYSFVRSGSAWTQAAKLVPPAYAGGIHPGEFGCNVSLSGDTALVGARESLTDVAVMGAACIYLRSGSSYTLQQVLWPADGRNGDATGSYVAVRDSVMVVGAFGRDRAGADSGSALVLDHSITNSWDPPLPWPWLSPLDAAPGDTFGTGVATNGSDRVVIGARQNDGGGNDAGAAYVFRRTAVSSPTPTQTPTRTPTPTSTPTLTPTPTRTATATPAATATPTPEKSILPYSQDFETTVGLEWSAITTSTTPVGGRRFLGLFGTQDLALTLRPLGAHTELMVSFDLYIIRSWDGSDANNGPDTFELSVEGGRQLLYTSFRNRGNFPGEAQAYPGTFEQSRNPACTGAAETGTLGYGPPVPYDSVYHLKYRFADTASSITLHFKASLPDVTPGVANEAWGIDNVKVEVPRLSAQPDAWVLY